MNSETTRLINSIHIDNLVNSNFNLKDIVSCIYKYDENPHNSLLHLIAGGTTTLELPLKLNFDNINCSLLIFTITGGLQISQGNNTVTSDMGTSVFVDLSDGAELFSTIVPCSFRFYIISGDIPAALSNIKKAPLAFHLNSQTPSSLTLDQLAKVPEKIETSYSYFIHARITEILCGFAVLSSSDDKTHFTNFSEDFPSYLTIMEELIHNHSSEPYSLNYFENKLGISKYRLCREYHAAYGVSPIQDLNHIRLQNAKKLLLTSSLQIQEISSSVGFDDVTHFIRLFKRETGYTPGQFRQSIEL